MDENRPMTKKELKSLRRMEKMEKEREGGSSGIMKWIILGIGAIAFLAFFTFIVVSVKQSKNQPVEIEIAEGSWVRGSSSASATLVEFGDLQCPACKRYEPSVQQLLQEFDGDLKLVFKHFPLSTIHPNAVAAAVAAEAAGQQGKFFEMHDKLFELQESWSGLSAAEARGKFIEMATDLDLDIDKFEQDLDNSELKAKVEREQDEGIKLGVNSTPTFFLNNKRIDNPGEYNEFKKLIEEELK